MVTAGGAWTHRAAGRAVAPARFAAVSAEESPRLRIHPPATPRDLGAPLRSPLRVPSYLLHPLHFASPTLE
ncbi:hypothetical protein GCM10010441_27640 [Kitasatospora paracochleata]